MKKLLTRTFDHLIPHAEDLWEAGGAEVIDGIPYFNPIHTENPETLSDDEFKTKSGRVVGRQVLYRMEVDGIGYASRVLVPNDEDRTENEVTILDSTAWGTTIDGYVGDRDAKLVIDNSVPLIATGAPHSDSPLPAALEFLRVPRTVKQSTKLSLAYSAQVEQMVAAYLSDQHGLPKQQVKIGDSRGSNISSGHYPYTKEHGAEIVMFDTKGRCAPGKIDIENVPEFVGWLVATGLGGIAVSACLASKGRLDLLKGTASLNPNFIASALTGTMRSLAGGETGMMIGWVPEDTHGHDVLYGLDSLADYKTLDTMWSDHENVRRKIVQSGTHAALLHPLAHSDQRGRISRFVTEYRRTGGDIDQIDWAKVYYGDKRLLEALEEAA